MQAFKDIYKTGKYNDIDFKLLDKMVKYGEIYEYTYIDNGSIKSKIINPEDSYPVFNETGEMIAFIEYYTVDGISYYTVYEPDIVSKYNDAGNNLKLTGTYKNLSGLPIQYKTIDEEDDCKGRSSLEDFVFILDNMEEILSKYGDSFFKFLNPIPVVSGTKLAIGKDGEGSINPNVVGYTLQLEDGSTFDLTQAKMDFQSLKAEYSCVMKSQFRRHGNHESGTGNHLLLFSQVFF